MSEQQQFTDTVTDYVTREAWLDARHRGIGASESAALFDLSPWDSRFSLWAKKTGPVENDTPEEEDDTPALDEDPGAERMTWGRLLEGPIAERFQKRTKRKLWQFSDYCIAWHPRIPSMFSTIDRFIIEAPDRQGRGNLEIKNSADHNAWWDGPPQHYLCQVQHQLAVTGRDYATLVVLLRGNRLRWWDVDRNEAFIAELEISVQEFWADVQAKKKPAVDGHKATLAALKKLHPADNGEVVDLPPDAATWWQKLEEAKAAAAVADAAKKEADAALRAAIGDASFGRIPGGLQLSLKTTPRSGYTVEPCTYRTLRKATKKDEILINARTRRAA